MGGPWGHFLVSHKSQVKGHQSQIASPCAVVFLFFFSVLLLPRRCAHLLLKLGL